VQVSCSESTVGLLLINIGAFALAGVSLLQIQVHSNSWKYIIVGNFRAVMLLKDLSDMVSMDGKNGYLPRGSAAFE